MSGGRGGPKTGLSFNAELLGIGRGKDALPTTVLAPPSAFPPLAVKAKQPLKTDESDYLLALTKEFRIHMRDSCFFLRQTEPTANKISGVKVDRYSDRFQEHVQKPISNLDWKRFPKELAPVPSEAGKKRKATKRKAISKPNLVSKIAKTDVLKKLEELEASEVNEGAENEEGEEGDAEEGDGEEKENEEIVSETEEADEELDEGTDYANNYFDNGEGYLDEDDDGMDEGGIY